MSNNKQTVHVDYGPWEVVEFEDRADVGQLPHDACCSCGVAYRQHFDANGKWLPCFLAFKHPQHPTEKIRTVPQWGGAGGR